MSDALSRLHAFPHYPEPASYIIAGDQLRAWEYNGWKAESLSWKHTCYIHTGLSGPLSTIEGPDAEAFMAHLCTNRLAGLEQGTMRHAVMCDDAGMIAAHGILQRYDDGHYRHFATPPWALFKAGEGRFNVTVRMEDRYLSQIAGPLSLEALQRASGEDLSDIGFLRYRDTQIAGKRVEVGRIGMSGNLAYEVRGPMADGAAVYDAIYQANREIGIERLGWRTYLVNHVEGGFPQMMWTFGSAMFLDPAVRAALGPDHFAYRTQRTGSYPPSDNRARLRNPFEVNWDKAVRFDHDFIGRAALEAIDPATSRRTVTLRWNAEDVIDIHASLYQQGEEYKTMDLPTTPTWAHGMVEHADRVLLDGREVGVSSGNIYSYHFRQQLSLGCIDPELAVEGTELIVEWGDHGRRIKPVRVTVERFPYLTEPRNSDA